MIRNNRTRTFLSVLAMCLVLVFVTELVPAYAADLVRNIVSSADPAPDILPEGIQESDAEAGADTAQEPEPYVIGEDHSLRSETTKYYRLSNGSYAAVSYEEAVHYQDENGAWQEIDNRLSEQSAENDGFAGMENKENPVKIKFAKKSNSNFLYRIKDGGYSIFIGADKKAAQKPNKVNAVISQNDTIEETVEGMMIQEAATLKKNIASVTYPGIWNNTDLQYVINGTKVKETHNNRITFVHSIDKDANFARNTTKDMLIGTAIGTGTGALEVGICYAVGIAINPFLTIGVTALGGLILDCLQHYLIN